MLTVLRRPQSCRITTENTSYSIASDGYGTAVLTSGSGLNTFDKVLITNTLDSYNGFWQVIGSYLIPFGSGGLAMQYTQGVTNVRILKCEGDVRWSCVHLPIVYKLLSNLWPVNTSDSTRAIVGFQNDNGLVRITLSGSITAEALDYLDIQSTTVDELDGPFQIVTKWSATQYTINAPFALASTYTYATATAQKYYNNYHARVKIYAGLNASHLWASLKPYTLITTLKIVPDEEGNVFVNVAEHIKQAIQIVYNRPNYDSAPYDLDRFCQFYIEYAEVYDVQGVATEGSYTSDQLTFEGWAADSKLEFKNRYSGFLSDYAYAGSTRLAKFLVNGRPTQFSGWYFDLSIIGNFSSLDPTKTVKRDFYDQYDNLISSVTLNNYLLEYDGVLRFSLSNPDPTVSVVPTIPANAAYQIVTVYQLSGMVQISEALRVDINTNCYDQYIYLTWKNNLGGFNYWLFTGLKDYSTNILETQQKDRNPFPTWDKSYGEFADTLSQEVSRRSRKEIVVRSQNLTRDQLEVIKTIKTSALVMQMTSQYDRRTVLVDSTSFIERQDQQKNAFEMSFRITFTDELPSQSL